MENVRISHVLVMDTPKQVTSAHGKASLRHASVIFMSPVGGTNAVLLSDKQLDHLCATLNLSKGYRGWKQLSALVGTGGRAAASVTIEEHKRGESYTIDGEEKQYEKDWSQVSINTIVLSDAVQSKLNDAIVKDVVADWSNFSFNAFQFDEKGTGANAPE